MASVGPILCDGGATVHAGDVAWTNPGNITADDSTNATCVLILNQNSDELTATWFGSDFAAIPDTALINGFAVDIRRRNLAGTMEDILVSLDVGGIGDGIPDSTAYSVWASSYETHREGSATDLWHNAPGLAGVDVTGGTHTVKMQCKCDSAGTAAVDWIKLTVFYTVAGGPVQFISSMASCMQTMNGGMNG